MKKVYNKDLLTCFNNLEVSYNQLLKVTKNEHVTESVPYVFNKIKQLRPLLKTPSVSEEVYSKLEEALQTFDGFYDLVECYPDEIGIPSTFKVVAMPSLSNVLDQGITELDRELLYKKGYSSHYLPFNFNL